MGNNEVAVEDKAIFRQDRRIPRKETENKTAITYIENCGAPTIRILGYQLLCLKRDVLRRIKLLANNPGTVGISMFRGSILQNISCCGQTTGDGSHHTLLMIFI